MSKNKIDSSFSFFILGTINSYIMFYNSNLSLSWPNPQFYVIVAIASFSILYLIILNMKNVDFKLYEIIIFLSFGGMFGYLLELTYASGSFSTYVSYFEFFLAIFLILFLKNKYSKHLDEEEIKMIHSTTITIIFIQFSELIGWFFAGIDFFDVLVTISLFSYIIYILFYNINIKIRITTPILRGLILGILQFIHINGNIEFTGSLTPKIILISLFLYTMTEDFNKSDIV